MNSKVTFFPLFGRGLVERLLLFINNFHLLTNRFFVDGFENFLHKLAVHTTLFALRATFFQDFIVTSGLKNGDSMLFL